VDKFFPGATWTSSHVYGQGLINRSRGLTYYNTPKCASMWMRKYISDLGTNLNDRWDSHNFTTEDSKGLTPVIIVRDPVQRWLSQCPMADGLPTAVAENTIDSVFENFEYFLTDEHTTPQYNFIDGLDLTHAVYFWCDNDLSTKMKRFFDSHGFTSTTPPAPVNEQEVQPNVDAINQSKNIWRDLLSRPKYFEVFKQAYSRDYALINSVTFYE